MTLSGNTAYTGATNINGGALLITGNPTGTGLISVGNAGATLGGALGGSGTIAAPVTVNALGHLAPALTPSSTERGRSLGVSRVLIKHLRGLKGAPRPLCKK